VAPGLGRASPVAGGGRYDGLIASISGAGAMPAVGVAIHTERLLAIAAGGTP
jgi:ATP phosphoribosyltransferase regulatory subunit